MPQGDSDLGGMKAKRPKDATMALKQPKETPVLAAPDRSKNLGDFLHKSKPENKGTGMQDIQVRAIKTEEDR
jgi:hypothetical protein